MSQEMFFYVGGIGGEQKKEGAYTVSDIIYNATGFFGEKMEFTKNICNKERRREPLNRKDQKGNC